MPTVAEKIGALSSTKLLDFERCPERCRRLHACGPRAHTHSVYQAAGAILDAQVKHHLGRELRLPCPPLEELEAWVSPLQARGRSYGLQLWEGYQRTGALAKLAEEVVAVEPARLLPGGEPDPEDPRGWRVRGELEGRPLTMRPDALIDSGLGEGIEVPVPSRGPTQVFPVGDGRAVTLTAEGAQPTTLRFDCIHDWKTSGVVRGAQARPYYLRKWVGGVDTGFHPDLKGLVAQAGVDWEGRRVGQRDPYLIAIEDLPTSWATQLGLYALGLGVRRVAVDLVYARPGWRSVECAQYRARVSGGFEDKLRARVKRFWDWADATEADVPVAVAASREMCWAYNSPCEAGKECESRIKAGIEG